MSTSTTGMAPPKSKTWCFTLNNPEESPDGVLSSHWATSPDYEKFVDLEGVQLLVVGYEIGESGTPHFQGYVTFKYSKTLTAVKKICGKSHWEAAKQVDAAANYCIKDGNYKKIDRRTQGARTDVTAAIACVREHGVKRLKVDHPEAFLKYHAGFEKLDVLNEEERDFRPDVVWLHGKTGTGKSHYAKNIYPGRTRWWSGRNLKWWQAYRGEDIAIIDDFRKDFCTFHELLRILDCYPYTVEIKGSHRQLNSRMIIITTVQPPWEMYDTKEPVRLAQLLRRITKVISVFKTVGGLYHLVPEVRVNRALQWEDMLSIAPAGEENAEPSAWPPDPGDEENVAPPTSQNTSTEAERTEDATADPKDAEATEQREAPTPEELGWGPTLSELGWVSE